jgi:hypothetical protein
MRTSEARPRTIRVTDHEKRIADLELSHDELRVALIVAAREIKKLNFGRSDNQILRMLRAKLREARQVRYESKGKIAS